MDLIKAKGGKVTREPGPVKGGNTVIAFVEDPDGYKFELLERGPTPEPLCQVMLRVGDLDRSINFYEKVRSHELISKRLSFHWEHSHHFCTFHKLLSSLLVTFLLLPMPILCLYNYLNTSFCCLGLWYGAFTEKG